MHFAAELSASEKLEAKRCYNVGQRYYTQKLYKLALLHFNKALVFFPKANKILVARALCNVHLGNYDESIEDTDIVLAKDSKNVKALTGKAESLYRLGFFEDALVYYSRAMALRPEIEKFRLGCQKSKDAISNCIGSKTGIQMKGQFDSLSSDPSLVSFSQIVAKNNASNKYNLKYEKENREERSKKLLGHFYEDKNLFAVIAKIKDPLGCMKNNSKEIVKLSLEGVQFLQKLQDHFHKQKPFYARDRTKTPLKPHPMFTDFKKKQYLSILEKRVEEKQMQETKVKQKMINDLMNYLSDFCTSLKNGSYNLSYTWSCAVEKILLTHVGKSLSLRPFIIATLQSILGNIYLGLRDFDEALILHERDLFLSMKYDLPSCKRRAEYNIGIIYAMSQCYKKAIGIWESMIGANYSDAENTWLHHEIGRCYLEMDNVELARDFGEKGLVYAKGENLFQMQLKLRILLAQCELQEGSLDPASKMLMKALALAIDYNITSYIPILENSIKNISEEMNIQSYKKEVEQEPRKMEDEDDDFSRQSFEKEVEPETLEIENEDEEDGASSHWYEKEVKQETREIEDDEDEYFEN